MKEFTNILTVLNKNIIKAIIVTACITSVQADEYETKQEQGLNKKPINIEMFAPAKDDRVGIAGRGWFVDLAVQYNTLLEQTGFSGFQLTGPLTHNNTAPFPGTFSPGVDERLPGLVVLISTTAAGSCLNLANLFNLTGVTNMTGNTIEIWDTWLVGAPNFGVNTESRIYVAVADDLNGDGIYNDAPSSVDDFNGDGVCNAKDLKKLGIASNIATTKFYINP